MKNKTINISFLVFLFLFLIFLKIDFRFAEEIYCCGDDHDYFLHAETIGIDFDLDYSNQLKGIEDRRFNKNNKIAPVGFIGSGILSAPFLAIGNLLDFFYEKTINKEINLLNYKILFYSMSPVFYLFLSFKLIISSFDKLNISYKKREVLILLFGSGVIYYAFERFSMTHVYEVFVGILIFYFCTRFYISDKKENYYAFLIPISILLGILVRWVNYYFLVIPFIFRYLFYRKIGKKNLLRTNFYFFSSVLFSILTFLSHTKALYGKFTIDPRYVYNSNLSTSSLNTLGSNPSSNIFYDYLNNLKIILFSQEFGAIYFSPIISFTFLLLVIRMVQKKEYLNSGLIIVLLSYLQVFSIYYIWQSSGSGYGLRYLYSLVPISIFAYYAIKDNQKNSYIHNLALVVSVFAIFSVLFFETTEGTQLSLEGILNSWGHLSRYAERYYLTGLLESFITFDAYLKIFTTSFLGAIFFKILILIFGIPALNELLLNLGLPVANDDFQNYLVELSVIGVDKFVTIFFLAIFLFSFFYKKV